MIPSLVPRLRGFAYKRLGLRGADLDDIVQETVLRALRAEHRFDGKNPLGWMFTIMRNQWLSRKRHDKIAGEVSMFGEEGEVVHSMPVPGGQQSSAELSAVLSAMVTLPLDMIDAMVLSARGHNALDAAEACGVAEGTIKSRVHRGRLKVKELIGEPA